MPRDDDLARWVRRGACLVGADGAGVRLDLFLARQFPYRSRTGWASMIRDRRVRLNGVWPRPGRALRPGDRIEYMPHPKPEPQVTRRYAIIHEDEAVLAIRKPANLPVHPSGRYFRNTLLSILLEERGEDLRETDLRIVHRLDRETSGLILFGKGREAAAALSGQFEHRQVRKRYLAIVHGVPREDRFLVQAPIGRDPTSPIRKAVTVTPDGRHARTGFRVMKRGPEHSLVLAEPYTGRLHQIRVHLRHAGFPIVGDKVYGLDARFFLRFVGGALTREDRARLGWRRQALHAWSLRFRHPSTGATMLLQAPRGSAWKRWEARMGLAP